MEYEEIFRERIRELRLSKGLSQSALGEALGMSYGAICDIERGRRTTGIFNVAKLADFFDVSIDYLVGRDRQT